MCALMDPWVDEHWGSKLHWPSSYLLSYKVRIFSQNLNNQLIIINCTTTNKSDLGGERVSEKTLNKTKEKEVQWNNFKKVHVEKKKKSEEHRNLFLKSVNKHIIAKRILKPKASIVSIGITFNPL